MVSRHGTGLTYSLARNSSLNTSMRGECAICGRGVEFSTGLSVTLSDFSSSVFIALTGFPHGVFLSPAQWKGLPSRLIQPHLPSQSLPDRLSALLNG